MIRTMIASALSAALLITPVAVTPAHADEDVLKVLGGIAALVILNDVVNDRQDRKVATRQATHRQSIHRQSTRRQVFRHKRHSRIAPRHCLRNVWTHRGTRQVYGARCMQRSVQFALPSNCLRSARFNNGPSRFYSQRCLRQNGWRI